MVTSPDYLRLATSASRTLADAALDGLPAAVLVIDARHAHLPLVLANACARRNLLEAGDPQALVESPVRRVLAGESSSQVEAAVHALSESQPNLKLAVSWRFAQREVLIMTDIKLLDTGPGRRVVMLSFDPATPLVGAASVRSAEESRWLELTEHARDIVTVAEPNGTLRFVSGGIKNLLGYTPEERRSHSIFEKVHPEDYPGLRAKFQLTVDRQLDGFSREFRARHKDGSYRWLETSYVSALKNPLIGGIVINARDITERKLAEFKLSQREEVFRLAAEAVDGVIFEWDILRGVVQRSRGLLEVLGIEPDDMDPSVEVWLERIHPDDMPNAKKVVDAALAGGRSWTVTYRIRDARGRYRSMLERALIQRNTDGDPVRAIGCSVDVSQIKRLSDILVETQRTAKMGGWDYSYITRELTWTEEMFRIFETTPAEFPVSWENMVAQLAPASVARFEEACAQAETGVGAVDLELEITTLKGQRAWVRIIGHVELLNGRAFRSYGSVQNIQAKKLAQMALEHSTEWLKLSMSMAHMHAWRWDRTIDSFEFAALNGQEARLPGVHASMGDLLERIHPGDRTAVTKAIDNALQFLAEVQVEYRSRSNSGRYRWYAIIARPTFDAHDVVCGLVGVIQDITARRDADVRLRRSEELLRATTANTADILFLVDADLRVRFINKPLGALTTEQIIGRGFAMLVPDASRTMVLAKLRDIFSSGETATYEFQADQEGETRYYENRAVLVRDNGIGTGISISMRDITERKRMEQEILDVSGRERDSIGRDLHDGLGQELTGVALMLRGLASRIQRRCPEAIEYVDEIVMHVNQSIESARSLARGLLPVRTENGGLASALRALATRSRDLYGLEVNFRAEVWPQLNLTETTSSHLYRIAQEALTNAARHGHATLVDILLLVTRDTFLLRITDNGEGFHPQTSPYLGMGLKIMQYRAGMIGAKFEIGANSPQGTVIRIAGEQPAVLGKLQSPHGV